MRTPDTIIQAIAGAEARIARTGFTMLEHGRDWREILDKTTPFRREILGLREELRDSLAHPEEVDERILITFTVYETVGITPTRPIIRCPDEPEEVEEQE